MVARGRRVGLVLVVDRRVGRQVRAAFAGVGLELAARGADGLVEVRDLARGDRRGAVGGPESALLSPPPPLEAIAAMTAPMATRPRTPPATSCSRRLLAAFPASACSRSSRSRRRRSFSSWRLDTRESVAVEHERCVKRLAAMSVARLCDARRAAGAALRRGFQHSSKKAAISPVRRSGVSRSSSSESARSRRALGSSRDQRVGVAEGVDGSRVVADDQRRRGDRARGSSRCGATRPKKSPCSTAADGPGCWRTVSSSDVGDQRARPRGTMRATRETRFMTGSPKVSAHDQRREGDRTAQQRVVEHRHLDDHAAHRSGRAAAASSVALAPSEVPPTTASSTSR